MQELELAENYRLNNKFINIIFNDNRSIIKEEVNIYGYLIKNIKNQYIIIKAPVKQQFYIKQIKNNDMNLKYSIDPLYYSSKPPIETRFIKINYINIGKICLDPLYSILSNKKLIEDVVTIIIKFLF